ncbi:MAG: hypothetical protein JNM25_07920 [Planctomycetes bacterium]|nr:hypothetical protein [Planctomycetota bacterium]
MDLLHWLLFGVLPALAVVLVFVGIGGPRLLGLALAVAICVPMAMSVGLPAWPWHIGVHRGDPVQWLWWCLVAAGVVGAAYDLRLLPRWLLLPCELLLVALLPWLLSGEQRAGWSFEWCVVMLSVGWAFVMALWWVLRQAAKLQPGMTVPLVGTIALVADALVLRAQGGRLAWELAGIGAVALGVSVATTIWRRPFVCGGGGTLCIALAHAGILLAGRGERHLLQTPFLLALVAPLALWIATTKVFAEGRATGMVVGVCATAALAAAAIAAA